MALVLDACAQPASSPECSRHVERRKSGDHQAVCVVNAGGRKKKTENIIKKIKEKYKIIINKFIYLKK